VDELVDAPMPLFLESGRQLGSHFKYRAELTAPRSEREAAFLETVRREGVRVYSRE
jgi:hypothetical protein